MDNIYYLISEISSVQEQYRELVRKSAVALDLNYYQSRKCLCFIDDIRRFWLERKEILRYSWDRITDHSDCFILSAAINLKVKDYNHYSLKAAGVHQLLHDPFIKMERFLRAPQANVDTEEIEKQFRHIMKDTTCILDNYINDFAFIDLSIIGEAPEEEKMKTIRKGFNNFLRQTFNREDIDNLSDILPTYELIEKSLDPSICQMLVFNDGDNSEASIGARVENFVKHQKGLSKGFIPDNECDRFLMALFCLYSQAVDTILSCLAVGMYPFFRSETPAKHFLLLSRGYSEDSSILEFIWKAISAYFIGKNIEQLDLDKIPFEEFKKYLACERPYEKLISSFELKGLTAENFSVAEISKTVKPIIEKLRDDLQI